MVKKLRVRYILTATYVPDFVSEDSAYVDAKITTYEEALKWDVDEIAQGKLDIEDLDPDNEPVLEVVGEIIEVEND